MKQKQIQQLFQQRYNQQRWKEFLAQTFTNARLYSTPDILLDINTDVATQALQLGNIKLNENGIERNIAVYDVTLASGIVLERNRVGLRNLLRKFWKDIDGAFIVFHRDGVPSWRFTYVSELKGFDAEGEWIEIKTEPKRYTYVLGELESCRTASQRFAIVSEKGDDTTLDDIKEAFSVEKLSKSFFEEYKRQYELFCDYMINQPSIFPSIFESDDKAVRDFTKKMLGRIVFLFFIQKKGWMGVPENEEWGSGDLDFLGKLFNICKHPELFYSEYLCKLFFSTLNTKRPNDIAEIVPGKKIRIPFLNGGLFEEDNPKFRDLIFPKDLFSDLFDFFNQYNFTIYEDDPNDQTVAVDPEMLGHIFENLLEDNKDKGAFYTPKEIVHYMCQESLIEYLSTHFESKGYEVKSSNVSFDKPNQPELFPINEGRKGQLTIEATTTSNSKEIDRVLIEKLLKQKLDDADKDLVLKHANEFNKALDKVKICDPAIGSGAFPMGLLKEIFNAKQTLYTFKHGSTKDFDASEVKLNIIQNSIYGVDIEKGAVDIARLRFWLSLVVDEETPKALPNLDYKIVVGDSLVSKLGDDIIDIDWSINKEDNSLFGSELVQQKLMLLKEISIEQKEFFNPHSDKKKQATNIRNLKIDLLINQLGLMIKTANQETKPRRVNFGNNKKYVEATELYLQSEGWKKQINKLQTLKAQPNKPLKFFDWKLDFPEVMNEQVAVNVGFDIVIGNPPYVDSENMSRNTPILREHLRNKYLTTSGNWDLFVPFIERGLNLNTRNGCFSYIIPNKMLSARYTVALRELLSKKSILEIRDYSRINVFTEANVYPITLLVKNDNNKSPVKMVTMESNEAVRNSNEINPLIFYNDIYWDKFFFDQMTVDVLVKLSLNKNISCVNDFNVVGAATVNEAYLIKEKIVDSNNKSKSKKLINTGTIDKWTSFWGVKRTQYIKDSYLYPVILDSELRDINITRLEQAESPKIIIAGMSKEIESFLDIKGDYLAGKSTSIILDNIENLKIYSTILNSKVASFFVSTNYHSLKMSGGYLNVSRTILESIPYPRINSLVKDELIRLVSNITLFKSQDKDTSLLEEQIDYIVYKLYELTYDEVKVIDSEFPLSKEEYDNLELK